MEEELQNKYGEMYGHLRGKIKIANFRLRDRYSKAKLLEKLEDTLKKLENFC